MTTESDIIAAASGGLLDELTAIVSRAGAAIQATRAAGLNARTKRDRSAVTAADVASEAIILEGLARLLPGMAVVSEEAAQWPAALSPDAGYVLLDPLDGTRELLAGRDEYTINLAIVTAAGPAVGVVAAPALGRVWRGIVGRGADRLDLAPGEEPKRQAAHAIRTRQWPHPAPVAIVSRSHFDAATAAFLERIPQVERTLCGSALKFCRIAEGVADLYPRLAPTSEWDVAAGHALLAAAGGTVLRPDGAPLNYGNCRADFGIPGFVAWGDPRQATRFEG